ncbi:MAG TPA: molybdenum cofactor guanylyltransferase [Thermodesulfobacteriota bacterium]|nr:molybdenum cofactor guanylyltransferase [Thermodesulfobacteriota bacterium]
MIKVKKHPTAMLKDDTERNTSENISALILAGGKSRRLGKDKRLLIYKKDPLILRALRSAKSITQEVYVLISTKEDEEVLSRILGDVPFILDSSPGSGPLGALAGALSLMSTDSDYVLLLSADYPLLTGGFLLRMKVFLEEEITKPDVLVPLFEDVPQVTCAFYRRSIAEGMQRAFEQGERSLRRWVESHEKGVKYIKEETWTEWESHSVFFNLNTPQDYERFMNME